jgi:NAD-dependent deacetylase
MHFPPELLSAIRTTPRIAVLTGAGISAESGIPTFRQAQTGLWAQFDPMELATPQAFQRNPALVWEWYQWRRSLVAQAEPNPGHHALVRLTALVPALTLITQNVDGLHQRAGSPAVIELHGSITRTICSADRRPIPEWPETDEIPPPCPHCGAPLRPDVVWFGESLPAAALQAAFEAARVASLFFSIGTSALVEPAASLSRLALQSGAVLVEINPDDTPLTPQADFALRGPAGQILPALLDQTFSP